MPNAATIESGEGIVVPNLAEAEGLLDGPRAEAVRAELDELKAAIAEFGNVLQQASQTIAELADRRQGDAA